VESPTRFLNSRLDLAVFDFSGFQRQLRGRRRSPFRGAVARPREVQQQATRDNPDLRAALAAVREAGSGVTGARAGYLPSLALDYWYGIDAPRYAANSVINGQKFSNLGSSASATLSIPIWTGRHAEPHQAGRTAPLSGAARAFSRSTQLSLRYGLSTRKRKPR